MDSMIRQVLRGLRLVGGLQRLLSGNAVTHMTIPLRLRDIFSLPKQYCVLSTG